MNNYPTTVVECLDPDRKFKPAVLKAVRAFARSKPWRGTIDERCGKFRKLHLALATAYNCEPAKLIFAAPNDIDSTRSCFVPVLDTIILRGPLSVITYLHEAAHWLRRADEYEAVGWSINLFRRAFPRSFAQLRFDGHVCHSDDGQCDHSNGERANGNNPGRQQGRQGE